MRAQMVCRWREQLGPTITFWSALTFVFLNIPAIYILHRYSCIYRRNWLVVCLETGFI